MATLKLSMQVYVNNTYKISVLFKIHDNCFYLLFSVLHMVFVIVIYFSILLGWQSVNK